MPCLTSSVTISDRLKTNSKMISAKKIYYCKCKNNALLSMPPFCRFRRSGVVHCPFRLQVENAGKCHSDSRRKNIILSKKLHNQLFQPMQQMSVERTFRNLLYVYGRGRRRCGGPTILSVRFRLTGGKRGRMPFGRVTGKYKNNRP